MQNVLIFYSFIALFILIVWIGSTIYIIKSDSVFDFRSHFFKAHQEGFTLFLGIVWYGIFVVLFMYVIVPTLLDLPYLHAHAYPMVSGRIIQVQSRQVTIQGEDEAIRLHMDGKNHKKGDLIQVQYLPHLRKGIEIQK